MGVGISQSVYRPVPPDAHDGDEKRLPGAARALFICLIFDAAILLGFVAGYVLFARFGR